MNVYDFYKALRFANKKHYGQKRRNGVPYIVHPLRVSISLKDYPAKTIAILHDVLEDTDTTYKELEDNFGSFIAKCVETLTHKKNESYETYIARVSKDGYAKVVKICDIIDNLSDNPSIEQVERYTKALDVLLK